MPVSITVFEHEGDQCRVVIVHMYDVGAVSPDCQPVGNGYLKSDETVRIIGITIDLFPVQQSKDVYKVKVKTQLIGHFLYYRVVEPVRSHMGVAFMNDLKLV